MSLQEFFNAGRQHLQQHGALIQVLPDVAALNIVMVNVYFIGEPGKAIADGGWTLVDAGLPFSAGKIRRTAEELYGPGARPGAIILTHGHFDHTGALKELATEWDVPVFAHAMELPYLTGRSDYPPPDPTVGGGILARTSCVYPKGSHDFTGLIHALPADGAVPTLVDWKWIATPGHSPGHVSLWRENDRTLIAGDAFTTQKQESLVGVLTRHQEVFGPPMYFTPDWLSARQSVQKLAALNPEVGATGHGIPMVGPRLREELQRFADDFEKRAIPENGRYVRTPAVTDENGVVSLPPPIPDPVPKIVAGVVIVTGLAALLSATGRRDDDD